MKISAGSPVSPNQSPRTGTGFSLIQTAFLLILTTLLPGCGYQFGMSKIHLPPDAQTIAIPTFENNSFEPALERVVTHQVREAFMTSSDLKIVNDRQSAHLLIEGAIMSFELLPMSFDRNRNVVIENRVRITLEVRLNDQKTGETLWNDPMVISTADYFVQQDSSATRVARDRAIFEASESLARSIVHRVLEGSRN